MAVLTVPAGPANPSDAINFKLISLIWARLRGAIRRTGTRDLFVGDKLCYRLVDKCRNCILFVFERKGKKWKNVSAYCGPPSQSSQSVLH